MTQYQIFPITIETHQLDSIELAPLINFCKTHPTSKHNVFFGEASSSRGTNRSILTNLIFNTLTNKIQNLVNSYVETLRLAPVKITDSWFNILGPGSSIEPHRHELSIISGALYLDVAPGSASLRFHSPLECMRMAEWYTDKDDYLQNKQLEFPCNTGLLILFPSWLQHSTQTNTTERRVSVSFNTSYK
jgi:uncharacterized protein (TIGR02466 family)